MLNPNNIPDHPIVQNMMETGYPDGIVPKTYICPICGRECEEYYIDGYDDVIGCENCITMCHAEDWEDEQCE